MDFIFSILFLFIPVSIAKTTNQSLNENCQLSRTGKQENVVQTFNTEFLPQEWLIENADKLKHWFGTDKVKIVDGDMIITEKMEKLFMKKTLDRKAIKFINFLWPKGIVPYAIARDSVVNETLIKQAIQHWEENTCLTFPIVAHKQYNGPYVYFTNGSGCASSVGKIIPSGQRIILGWMCAKVGIIIHEIGHAIGFIHEHQRPDRDEYVIMDERNTNNSVNFDIISYTNAYDIPYDVTSIMHYSAERFSINGYFTLFTKDPWKQFDMGQRKGLSFYDLKLAHIIYNCSNHCNSKPKCENEGFLDKNCKCRCPPNFKGKKCQKKIKLPKPSCYIYIKKKATSFSTPNYPNNYPENARCIYKIKAPIKKRVKLTFNKFDFPDNYNISDRVEIRSTKDLYEGIQYSRKQLENKSIISEGNVIWIFLMTYTSGFTGFEANVTFI